MEAAGLTKHNEAGVCVCGAQWVLGCAAEHGAIELGRNSLQNQFPSNKLLAAVQQASAHSGPGEHGLGEHIALRTHQHGETHHVGRSALGAATGTLRKLTVEGPSWKPWTAMCTVSSTLAWLGVMDNLGPLGAAKKKKQWDVAALALTLPSLYL